MSATLCAFIFCTENNCLLLTVNQERVHLFCCSVRIRFTRGKLSVISVFVCVGHINPFRKVKSYSFWYFVV